MAAKTMDDLLFMNSDHFRPPRIMEMPELELHGLMTGSANETKGRMEALNCLVEDLKSLAALKTQSDLYAIRFSVDKKGQDYYQYIGAETNRFEKVSPMLVSSILPAGCSLYMDIPEGELALARSFLYSSWMPGAGLEARDDRQILCLNSDGDCTERMLTILIPLKENSRIKGYQGDTL
jgi:predicted transcriptional regulator YdeE